MKKQILIIGAGGHSKVVTEIINSSAEWEIAGYIDENSHVPQFQGRPVFRSLNAFNLEFSAVKEGFVAIGHNATRKAWHNILTESGYNLPLLKHPTACLSPSAQVGAGTLLAANAFVGADVKIGRGVIVNTGAIVDHDATVGDFSHISQGAIICGGAQVGSEVLLGPGCVLEKMSRVQSGTTTPPNAVLAAQ